MGSPARTPTPSNNQASNTPSPPGSFGNSSQSCHSIAHDGFQSCKGQSQPPPSSPPATPPTSLPCFLASYQLTSPASPYPASFARTYAPSSLQVHNLPGPPGTAVSLKTKTCGQNNLFY